MTENDRHEPCAEAAPEIAPAPGPTRAGSSSSQSTFPGGRCARPATGWTKSKTYGGAGPMKSQARDRRRVGEDGGEDHLLEPQPFCVTVDGLADLLSRMSPSSIQSPSRGRPQGGTRNPRGRLRQWPPYVPSAQEGQVRLPMLGVWSWRSGTDMVRSGKLHAHVSRRGRPSPPASSRRFLGAGFVPLHVTRARAPEVPVGGRLR